MGLGKELRNARLKKKLTASEVAAATRMKVQIVEDIEREDFSRIAAPVYGKGFIRLYAEHVGLDPVPLVDEYMSRFVGSKPLFVTGRTQLQIEEKVRFGVDTTAISDTGRSAKVQATQRIKVADVTRQEEPDLFSITDSSSATASISSVSLPAQSYRKQRASILSSRTAMQEADDGMKEGFSDVRSIAEKTSKKTIGLWKQLVEKLCEKVPVCRAGHGTGRITVPDGPEKHEFNLREVFFAVSSLRSISVMLGILIVLVFVMSCLYRCARQLEPETVSPLPETKNNSIFE